MAGASQPLPSDRDARHSARPPPWKIITFLNMPTATTFHASVTCPNLACQFPISLGCLEQEGCCRVPGDFDRRQLVCRRCGTCFELVADNLSLWPVITNPEPHRPPRQD